MQGLRWGIDDIPMREDFREKRYNHHTFRLTSSVKDYGSLIVKPPPPPVSINPVSSLLNVTDFRRMILLESIISINFAIQI